MPRAEGGPPPLRLLFVSAARRWTGGERCVTAVASGLAERGHAVLVAADPRGPMAGRLAPRVRSVALRVRNDADPLALARLSTIARGHRADAVCVSSFRELKLGGLAARLAGPAGVVDRMGATDALYDGARERLVYRALLDVLVRDSEWGCRRVRRENPWLERPVLLARNGIDAAAAASVRPATRMQLGAEEGEALIAVTGRGSAERSATLAAALREAVATFQAPMTERSCATGAGFAVRLVFLGRMRPETVEEIRAALAPGSLRASFPGELPPEEALAALAGCDVMARPSVTDGVSFAVLEAMALGLPVVAFAAGGLAEAVVDGVTGLLVPVRGTPAPVARASRRRWRSTAPSRTVPEATADVRAMAAALAQLAADSALRRRLGEAGRRRVREEFPERRMLDAYEAAFRLAAARGRPPASRTIAQASDAARSQLR